jgi:hypothetical protein
MRHKKGEEGSYPLPARHGESGKIDEESRNMTNEFS